MCKNSTLANEPKPPKPMEPEIVVQDPPKSLEQDRVAPGAGSTEEENLHSTIIATSQNAFQMLNSTLLELFEIYDVARKANEEEVTIHRPTLRKIGHNFQKGLEQLQEERRETKQLKAEQLEAVQHAQAQLAHEENGILNSLKHIQASIAGLEQKYEDIQAKVMENNPEMVFNKLNKIQATTSRLESNHKAMERTVKEVPKSYADIIKASATNTKEKEIVEMQARQRQQRDTLRQE